MVSKIRYKKPDWTESKDVYNATIQDNYYSTPDRFILEVDKNDDVDVGDEVYILDENDNKIFAGTIEKIEEYETKKLTIYDYGYKLNNIIVNEIYNNKTPEFIIQDLITNYTDLTYSSTSTSGITLSKYVCKDKKLNEVINELSSLLNWIWFVDKDKNFYFEPKSYQSSGVTLTIGTNARLKGKWRKDTSHIINEVIVVGDMATFNTSDSFTGDGSTKEFTLTYQPKGNVRILIDGTEQQGYVEGQGTGDYQYDKDNKKIIFDTAPSDGSNIVVYYEYEVPVKVSASNEDSINEYKRRSMKIVKKYINTMSQARKLADKFLSYYSIPHNSAKIEYIYLNSDVQTGKTINVVDSINNINQEFVINKVIWKYPEGIMEISVGEREPEIFDWNAEVMDRIKQLEQSMDNTSILQYYYLVNNVLNGNFTVEVTAKYRTIPSDVLIWGHPDKKWGTHKWADPDSISWIEL